ncbi:hypothetical protein JAAARDRAFT_29569 [Jaapia argillacea MUCL 33604]|uniref:Uncharacterized protein n=1 Tax=Jaapia argillacea MUCL 33604 TaxID=933084 RepID=A0A067Q923_9AGAM|nr:hypothetical protein JAAARDRAFT_29569 [Jaapia argillacea MUCL 33604]
MLVVLPESSSISPASPVSPVSSLSSDVDEKCALEINELGKPDDALEAFAKLLACSGEDSVRLHCTVPTWCPMSDTCLDLHDLHDLRSRSLTYIHNLIESLRSSGIPASYRLAPANSSLCLVCPMSPTQNVNKVKMAAFEAIQGAKFSQRDTVLLANLEYGPALVIT